MAGLDPAAAWDRTPGELEEYIEAYRERMRRQAYFLYNHACTITAIMWGKRKPDPWECFPGWIKPEMHDMSAEELYQSMLAWCGGEGSE